jgi:hypothetical protein
MTVLLFDRLRAQANAYAANARVLSSLFAARKKTWF